MSATIQLNGQSRPMTSDGLLGLLRELEIDPAQRGVAVALNGTVVPRADWAKTSLREGDALEVVKLFAGG